MLLIPLFSSPLLYAQQANSKSDRVAGIDLIKAGKNAEAIDVLQRFIKTNKQDGLGWYYLGVAFLQVQNFKKAVDAFEHATTLLPDSANAYNALGYAYLRRARLDDANKALTKALALDPTSADAHYTFGVLMLRKGDGAEARTQATLALASNANFADAYLLKSQAILFLVAQAILGEGRPGSDPSIGAQYEDAGQALRQFLNRVPDAKDNSIWKDQLESINFYRSTHNNTSSDPVYIGNAVTTKARLLSKPEPTYTEEARQSLITGKVVLRTVFAADGSVKHIMILEGLPYGLTERAVQAARKIKFVPATLNGQPVSMFMYLEYHFLLD
ncbi:MAG TPA: TonB family protein [Pyrinomonadaceae bacterium]|nr:TonB family protein [Pyrinomonadaceae bacterium]